MSPSSGTGTGTPIIGIGAPGAAGTAQGTPYTLLSLARYAAIMGIAPLHFHQGFSASTNPQLFPNSGCTQIWYQHDWQNFDQVSREQLAMEIANAEQEIANLVGYWPAPVFVSEDTLVYPRYHRREYYGTGIDIRGALKAMNSKYGQIVSVGQRATTLIAVATSAGGSLVYSDNDGDGFYEQATIVLPTSVTEPCEVKVYYSGHNGQPEWEIRSPRSITISGGAVTVVFNSWQLIDPDLLEVFPYAGLNNAIDLDGIANFVTSVDVYREYVDTTATAARFYWSDGAVATTFACTACGGTGCSVCGYTTQDGCLGVRDPQRGIIVPSPGTYNSTNAQWDAACWTGCREPDIVKLWYYAGLRSPEYINGYTCDPLPNFWAQMIAWIATARLDRPMCSCNNLYERAKSLQTDMSYSEGQGASFFLTEDVLSCPFGTKRGEVLAWRRIKRLVRDKHFGVAVI